VLEAIFSAGGTADSQGIAALLRLQVGCSGSAADQGGIAFQPGSGGAIVPDQLATAQATSALAEVALPITSSDIGTALVNPCTSPVTGVGSTSTTAATSGSASSSTSIEVSAAELPNTGSTTGWGIGVALVLILTGGAFLAGSRRRRAQRAG
jgi:LPXTG-motif cell wall-anchored protein